MNREERRAWDKGKHPIQQELQRRREAEGKTPLQRSRQPMRRTEIQRSRQPMKKQSKKRQKANSERTKVLSQLRKERRGCELRAVTNCTGAMDDGHEIHTRGRGGSIRSREHPSGLPSLPYDRYRSPGGERLLWLHGPDVACHSGRS